MNRYLKSFLHRGLIFGGFGPVVAGIVFLILGLCIGDAATLGGVQVFTMIVSTYLVAFVHAGSTVFNQIDEWSPVKSCSLQLLTLYLVYTVCYLVNSWIPFELAVIGIFSAIFIVAFLAIWLGVYFTVRAVSAGLNQKLRKN